MSRRKRSTGRGRTLETDGTLFVSCVLVGYGECDGEISPWECYNWKGFKGGVPREAVVGCCAGHQQTLRTGGRLKEHVGLWVPSWVWRQAEHPMQRQRILQEMMALRSTARTKTEGGVDWDQWPFWMENERRAALREEHARQQAEAVEA